MLNPNTPPESSNDGPPLTPPQGPRSAFHTQVPSHRRQPSLDDLSDPPEVSVPAFRKVEREEQPENLSPPSSPSREEYPYQRENSSQLSTTGSSRRSRATHTITVHRNGRNFSTAPADGSTAYKVKVKVTKDGKEVEEEFDPYELARLYATKTAALDSLTQKFDYFGVPEWVTLHPTVGCYLAEFTGTFAWVLTFSLTSVRNDSVFSLQENTDMTCITIGFMFTAVVFTLAYVSGGHFNPAISFAVFLTRNMDLITMLGYVLSQIAASVCAGFVAMLLQGSGSDIYVPYIESDYVSKGIFSELIFTLAIVLVVLNIGYSRQKGNFFYGFAVGMCVTAGSASVGHISGGSFNPAASTGLQLAQCISGDCEAIKSFWIYWLAPLIGSVIASVIYAQMLQPEDTQVLQDFMVFKDNSNNTMGDNDTRKPSAGAATRGSYSQQQHRSEDGEGEWYDSTPPGESDGEGREMTNRENSSSEIEVKDGDSPISNKNYF